MSLIKFIFCLFVLLYLSTFVFSKKKFATVNIICGLPGSGKTTCAAYLTRYFTRKKYLKSGYRVYSNVPIKGSYPYDFKNEFGVYDMRNATIILDEAGLEANNRDFYNFKYCQLEYIKLLRHRHNLMFVFSQTWDDMDKKIRTMAGMIWICKRSHIPGVTKLVPVKRSISVDEDDKQLKDIFYIDRPVLRFFTTRRFLRPLYYKMFDSYDAPYLTPYPLDREPYSFANINSVHKSRLFSLFNNFISLKKISFIRNSRFVLNNKINQGEHAAAAESESGCMGAAVVGEACEADISSDIDFKIVNMLKSSLKS